MLRKIISLSYFLEWPCDRMAKGISYIREREYSFAQPYILDLKKVVQNQKIPKIIRQEAAEAILVLEHVEYYRKYPYTFVVIDTGTSPEFSIVAHRFNFRSNDSETFIHDPFDSQSYHKLKVFMADHVMVGHNIQYDIDQINRQFSECGLKPISNLCFCTLNFSKNYLKGVVSHTLEGLCQHLFIWNNPQKPFHVTEHDVAYTKEVFIRLFVTCAPILFTQSQTPSEIRAQLEPHFKRVDFDPQILLDLSVEDSAPLPSPLPLGEYWEELMSNGLSMITRNDDQGEVQFFRHPLIYDHVLRYSGYEYQASLALRLSKQSRTVLIMDTGQGKTAVFFLAMIQYLHQHPAAKVLIITPTVVLGSQHYSGGHASHLGQQAMSLERLFREDIFKNKVGFLSGDTPVDERQNMLNTRQIICANAHIIEAMRSHDPTLMEPFQLLIVDEFHLAQGDHAMATVTDAALDTKKTNLWGITATPGSANKNNILLDRYKISPSAVIVASEIGPSEYKRTQRTVNIPLLMDAQTHFDLWSIKSKLLYELFNLYPQFQNGFPKVPFPMFTKNSRYYFSDLKVSKRVLEEVTQTIVTSFKKNNLIYGFQKKVYQALAIIGALGRYHYLQTALSEYGSFEGHLYLNQQQEAHRVQMKLKELAAFDKQNPLQDLRFSAMNKDQLTVFKNKRESAKKWSGSQSTGYTTSLDHFMQNLGTKNILSTLSKQYKDPFSIEFHRLFSFEGVDVARAHALRMLGKHAKSEAAYERPLLIGHDRFLPTISRGMILCHLGQKSSKKLKSYVESFLKEAIHQGAVGLLDLVWLFKTFNENKPAKKTAKNDWKHLRKETLKTYCKLTGYPYKRAIKEIERTHILPSSPIDGFDSIMNYTLNKAAESGDNIGKLFLKRDYPQLLKISKAKYVEPFSLSWNFDHYLMTLICLFSTKDYETFLHFLDRIELSAKIDPEEELKSNPKLQAIVKELQADPTDKTLIFAPTKYTVIKIEKVLNHLGYDVITLVGKKGLMGQTTTQQLRNLEALNRSPMAVGVATVEIAGQGLDISGLKKTILYIPLSDETKLVQTSGRIRKDGSNVTLCVSGVENQTLLRGQTKLKKRKRT